MNDKGAARVRPGQGWSKPGEVAVPGERPPSRVSGRRIWAQDPAFDDRFRSAVPEGTETLWSAKPELGSPDYGFGFSVRGDGRRVVGHGGGFAGIRSNLDMFLDSGYTALVLSNYDNGAEPIRRVGERLAERARPREAPRRGCLSGERPDDSLRFPR